MLFVFLFLTYFTLSTSLELTQIHSFLWLIFHCINIPHLYPFICQWTSRLLPCPGYCKHCCSEHWGTYVEMQPQSICIPTFLLGSPGGAVLKNLPANAGAAGDMSSIPGSGRSSGVGNGNSLQYSCLESSMDRGAR